MTTFHHFNFNVLDLEKSLEFYKTALDLNPIREIKPENGDFIIKYLSDGSSDFTLELTWLRGRTEPYDLGEREYHLAFATDEFDAMYARHKEMGVISVENPAMGVYFIMDPDGYWIEIVPRK